MSVTVVVLLFRGDAAAAAAPLAHGQSVLDTTLASVAKGLPAGWSTVLAVEEGVAVPAGKTAKTFSSESVSPAVKDITTDFVCFVSATASLVSGAFLAALYEARLVSDVFGAWNALPADSLYPLGMDAYFVRNNLVAAIKPFAPLLAEDAMVSWFFGLRNSHVTNPVNRITTFKSETQGVDLRMTNESVRKTVASMLEQGYDVTSFPALPASAVSSLVTVDTLPIPRGLVSATLQRFQAPSTVNSYAEKFVTNWTESDKFRAEVHEYIPGGAHTYSRGDDQFPQLAPASIVSGKGAHIVDLDGNKFLDTALGLSTISIGHAFEPQVKHVEEEIELGVAFQRPSITELRVAKKFLEITPGHNRIKFARNGSTVTTAAVKLARAYTGRPLVAFPKNHPFYSYDDWFIGHKPNNSGIPEPIQSLSVGFDSMRIETLEELLKEKGDQIACVIMEPVELDFRPLSVVNAFGDLCRQYGVIFILDFMIAGFRMGFPGMDGLPCDLATWGKASGNGFSFCAMTGKHEIMDLGGIKSSAPRVFLISTTHGAERGAVASVEPVIDTYRTHHAVQHLSRFVGMILSGARRILRDLQLESYIKPHIQPWRLVFDTLGQDGQVSFPLRTLLLQEMIGRGVLSQGVLLTCFTMDELDVFHYLYAFEEACKVYKRGLAEGADGLLVGQPIKPVFRKMN